MMVTEIFKGALVATAQIDPDNPGIVAICVIHKDQQQAVFEAHIDKLYDFLVQCRHSDEPLPTAIDAAAPDD